jgi:glucose-6-phosphate-specific signal transduction histidine kinase
MLDGMQIAFFAVAKLTDAERGNNTWAKKTCDILYNRRDGLNLPAFMIGRQLCVVTCFFVIARVTTQNVEEGEQNVMGLPDGVQNFLNFGFQGALICTILGSISWQLVAQAFPVAFLSNPVTYLLLRLCLFLEATGICNGAWVLAAIHRRVAGLQKDEVYIGTAEERRARMAKLSQDETSGEP